MQTDQHRCIVQQPLRSFFFLRSLGLANQPWAVVRLGRLAKRQVERLHKLPYAPRQRSSAGHTCESSSRAPHSRWSSAIARSLRGVAAWPLYWVDYSRIHAKHCGQNVCKISAATRNIKHTC